MKKEFIKTVVLTCLVISSLVLSAHILYEKELWSSDYNSFVHSSGNKSDEYSEEANLQRWNQTLPEFVAFTYGSQRMVSYQASPEFPAAYQMASELLASVEKGGNLVTVTEEEYLNAYKTNSVMLKFPSRVNLEEILEKGDGFFDSVSNPISATLVVGIGDSQNNYLTFMDDSSGRAYRMPVSVSADAVAIREQILSANRNDSFAFELNFDSNVGDTQRILFDRFVPMLLDDTRVRNLSVEPVAYSSSYDGVFKAFHIVKNSARSYRDKAGDIHFIENRSTLKIQENGAFFFEANEAEAGIALNEYSQKEAVTRFANQVYRSIVPESDGYLSVFKQYENGNQHVYEMMYYTPNGLLYQPDKPAARVVCEGNVIMKYEQRVLDVSVSDQTTKTTGVIEAYDCLYQQPDIANKSKERIKSMYPCNILENETVLVGWFCQFSDGTSTCFVP